MNKQFAAFGEVMMRLQVPGAELLSQASTLNFSFSGSGVNVTSALSRFGHKGYLISRLPDNPVGYAAKSYLKRLGVDTTYIFKGGNYIGSYFLENGFGPRPSRVTYSNRLESSFNTASEETYDFSLLAAEMDVVHFCGIALSINDNIRHQMKSFALNLKDNNKTVVFDCNFRPSQWGEGGYVKARPYYEDMLHLSDIVLMNEKDAIYGFGMETNYENRKDQLIEIIPKIARKYNISTIAGTHRSINNSNTHSIKGFMYKNQEFVFSKTTTFPILDRVGAGDAYASGIIHGDLVGFSPGKTVAFATAACVLAHTTVGDTPMSTESDVQQALRELATDIVR